MKLIELHAHYSVNRKLGKAGKILNSQVPVSDLKFQQVVNQRHCVLTKLSHVHTTAYRQHTARHTARISTITTKMTPTHCLIAL